MPVPVFYYFVYIWIGIAILSFPLLLRVTAPYGRHATSHWGRMLDNRLGWMLQEAPSLLFLSLFFFTGSLEKTTFSYFVWALWSAHYIYRSFIFPFRTKNVGKR